MKEDIGTGLRVCQYVTANGEDVKVISENLGHSDIKITLDLYTHVMDELKKRSARKLDGFTAKKKISQG